MLCDFTWKEKVYNGMLWLNNREIPGHSAQYFFEEDNFCVEFFQTLFSVDFFRVKFEHILWNRLVPIFTFRKDSLHMRMLLAGRNKANFLSYTYQSDGVSDNILFKFK